MERLAVGIDGTSGSVAYHRYERHGLGVKSAEADALFATKLRWPEKYASEPKTNSRDPTNRNPILSDQGIALADVYYTAAGDVLMGTACWQKEAAEKAVRMLDRAHREREPGSLL